MKHTHLALITVLTLMFSSTILAGPHKRPHNGNKFVDYARVVKVKPIYETVRVSVPEKQCWYERDHRRSKHRVRIPTPGEVAGHLIDDAVKHRLLPRDMKKVSDAAKGLIEPTIVIETDSRHKHRKHRHCKVENRYRTEQQIVGYRVRYRYRGETFVTRMRNHPGDRLQVRVSIRPLEDY